MESKMGWNNLSLIVLAFCLSFGACEKEYKKGCEGNGVANEVCKELRYENEVLFEAINYEYGNNNLVALKLHENKNGKNIGYLRYGYDAQNNVITEIFEDASGKVLIENNWTYNGTGEVIAFSSDISGVKQIVEFTYDNLFIVQEKTYENEVLKYKKVYSYFDNDTLSYDAVTYDQENAVLYVEQRRQFDSATARTQTYDGLGNLSGYVVELFGSSELLLEKKSYDGSGAQINAEKYTYDRGVVTVYEMSSEVKVNRKITYLRFD
jgi:hypothetical protein